MKKRSRRGAVFYRALGQSIAARGEPIHYSPFWKTRNEMPWAYWFAFTEGYSDANGEPHLYPYQNGVIRNLRSGKVVLDMTPGLGKVGFYSNPSPISYSYFRDKFVNNSKPPEMGDLGSFERKMYLEWLTEQEQQH